MNVWNVLEDAVVGFSFCWIVWVIFTALRRYLIAKTKAALQEKILQRIDSSEALVTLAANDSGRRFLESMTVEESQPSSPFSRILFGVQAGIVLIFFGSAMLLLHHHTYDPQAGFIITGIGAIGLGLGFLVAAVASVFVSRQLGLVSREPRG
jgi:small-conductance mechanosensitive channel